MKALRIISNTHGVKLTYQNLVKNRPNIKIDNIAHSNLRIRSEQKFVDPISPLISIVIPVYNEENSIQDVIRRIPNHYRIEIIVVDDGSTDNSVKNVKELFHEDKRKIILVNHKNNQGYGAAILTGFKHATGDIIVTMDSDGQHNPEEIPNLFKPIINQQADLVVGSRYLGDSNYKVPLHTRVGEFFISKCLWLLYNQKVANNQSGFRAFNRKCLKIFNDMIYTKFGLCTETLFKAACNKLRIREIPIIMNPREHGSSYIRLIKIMKSICLCILFYGIKEFKIKKIVPARIYYRARDIIIKFLKKIQLS